MSNNVSIATKNLSKTYYLREKGSISKKSRVQALKNAQFIASAGESIGVLGVNGSGKSTFLRLLAGLERPTLGNVYVSQKPTLLGVSAALQGHLSGSANVTLGLLAMGLSKEEASELQPEVIEWAGLTEAANRPMRTYSSGMQARLKFAIATSIQQDILLVDEALSTGDETFAKKAKARMRQFVRGSGTMMLVSHAPGTIETHCSRSIWIHRGEIIADDRSSFVTKYYRAWMKYVSKDHHTAAEKVICRMRDYYEAPNWFFTEDAERILNAPSP